MEWKVIGQRVFVTCDPESGTRGDGEGRTTKRWKLGGPSFGLHKMRVPGELTDQSNSDGEGREYRSSADLKLPKAARINAAGWGGSRKRKRNG